MVCVIVIVVISSALHGYSALYEPAKNEFERKTTENRILYAQLRYEPRQAHWCTVQAQAALHSNIHTHA